MTEQRIEPHKVTKPIQLLAAWLVGLVVTNTIFLTSALHLESSSWERGALVISAIANVPLFLLALFILQTRFRAELQEDTYYSEYLSKKTATVVRIDRNSAQDSRLDELERQVLRITETQTQPTVVANDSQTRALDWTNWAIALNELHPKFDQIREALRSANVPLAEIFDGNHELPKLWIIAISHYLPVPHSVHLLRVLLPFGFDGFQFWEPQRDAEENEDVYIGSYGGGSYARVTPELETLINREVEPVDLSHYYKRHQAERPK